MVNEFLTQAVEFNLIGFLPNIEENLYEEFLGKYSKSKDENELRALAKHKVEDYFDSFWE